MLTFGIVVSPIVGLIVAGSGIAYLLKPSSTRRLLLVSLTVTLAFGLQIVIFHDYMPCPPDPICQKSLSSNLLLTATECLPAPGCGLGNILLMAGALVPFALFLLAMAVRLVVQVIGHIRARRAVMQR